MAIVVEDGTGLSNSNSYITEAELIAYAAARGVTIANTITNEQLLITAMDYIEQQPFKGVKGTDDQALQWPRFGVVVDGYPIDTNEIPLLLKDAQAEQALGVDQGNNPLSPVGRETRREKVDVLEVEYAAGAREQVYLKAAEFKLQKLLNGGIGFGISARAIRG